MFDKDLNSYLRTANRALPCGAAHIAFAHYVNEVAQDVLRNDPGADFAAVTEQLGPTPRQAAEDFVDSQPPETQSRWEAAGRRKKCMVWLAIGLVIVVLSAIVIFFMATKGIHTVTVEPTIINWGDTDITLEETLQKTMQLPQPKE